MTPRALPDGLPNAPRGRRDVAMLVIAVVAAAAALKLARPVVLPLVAGLFVAVLARPLQQRLRGMLPPSLRWLGLTAAMLVVTAVLAAFAAAVGLSGRAIVDELQARRPHIERQLERMRPAAARVGISLPELPGAPAPRGPTRTEARHAAAGSDVGKRAVAAVAGALGGLGLTLAFAALALAEADDARRRVIAAVPGDGERPTLEALDETAAAFRRYVWVKSITSAIAGVATTLLSLAFGLPLAAVWGFVAFLLEYAPTIGSLLAVVPPTLMALADGGGPVRALAVLGSFTVMQIVLGNVLDPRIEGRLMSVSPLAVLLAIVFWGWLWGAVGALLAVPLTVAIVIACRHLPGARGVATLLAGDGVDPPRATEAAGAIDPGEAR